MTAITINIPNRKVGFFKYLNDKTMKAIEDVRSGKDKGTTYESFEDFKKAMLAL